MQQSVHLMQQTWCSPHAHPPRSTPPPDDSFREKFLWGRRPMLAACAARLEKQDNMVWVDLGGGTGVRREA